MLRFASIPSEILRTADSSDRYRHRRGKEMQFISEQELATAEEKYTKLSADLLDLETKLATARQRMQDLREGNAAARKNSRRMAKSINMLTEALQEIDSFIFTVEYKLRRGHEELAALAHMIDDWKKSL
jgi:septation ring formation regulator EzrA